MRTANDGKGSVPRHLDDAELISYLDGELERTEQDQSRLHLEGCWNCRSRLLAMQNSIENFLRTRKQILPDNLPPSNAAVAQFRSRLTQHRNAPVTSALRLSRRLSELRQSLRVGLVVLVHPIFIYKKTALASLLVMIAFGLLLLNPFKWNSVSAGELLSRAATYELLNETPSGKVVRSRARLERIDVATKVGKDLGQFETDADNLSRAIFVSAESATSIARRQTLSDREKQSNVDLFVSDFNADTAKYLSAQVWLPQVSVSLYRRLIAGRGLNGNDGISARRDGDSYQIRHAFAAAHSSHITETLLTVDAQTYAAQSVSIFTAEGDEHFEYRLTRVSLERIERTPEVAKLFETPKESVVIAPKRATASEPSERQPEEISTPAAPAPVAATAELEVEVLRLLNQVGADMGEQISVTRSSEGQLLINGVVETDDRKRELLRMLEPVRNNSAVRIQIKSVAEVQRQPKNAEPSGPVIVERPNSFNTTSPVDAELQRYFVQRGESEEQASASARRFANRVVDQSGQVLQHAWAVKRLTERFSAEQLHQLSPDARANWLVMIKEHCRTLQQINAGLRRELQPIFFPAAPAEMTEPGIEFKDDADLMRAAERLLGICASNEKLISAAFTVSSASSSAAGIKTPQFVHSLRSAEALASRLARAQ